MRRGARGDGPPRPAARATALAVLGYPDIYSAAERVPELLEHRPATVEGIDAELVAAFAARNPRSGLPASLPTGRGWLLVETVGETAEEAEDAAYALVEAMAQSGVHSEVSIDPRRVGALLWRLREEGAGIATRLASGGEAWPGWEDAAVPPERLGAYLRQFRTLMANTGTRAASSTATSGRDASTPGSTSTSRRPRASGASASS